MKYKILYLGPILLLLCLMLDIKVIWVSLYFLTNISSFLYTGNYLRLKKSTKISEEIIDIGHIRIGRNIPFLWCMFQYICIIASVISLGIFISMYYLYSFYRNPITTEMTDDEILAIERNSKLRKLL